MTANKTINKFIGLRLKELRNEKGLTREELSALINLPKESIVNYENSRQMPGFEAMVKFEKFYHVTATYLSGETDSNDYEFFAGNALFKASEFKENLDKLNKKAETLSRHDTSYLYQSAAFLMESLLDDELPEKYYGQYLHLMDELASWIVGTLKHLKAIHSPSYEHDFINPHTQRLENIMITLREIEELYIDYYKKIENERIGVNEGK